MKLDTEIIPVELDADTLTRFAQYCLSIGRRDVARCAAEVFRDLVWDDEFAGHNRGRMQ